MKAAGRRQMKTVTLSGLSQEFEQQWLSWHSSKVKFMAECKAWCQEKAPDTKETPSLFRDRHEIELLQPDEVSEAVTEAIGNGDFAAAQALTPQLRAIAVELFRRYFSPDMYFIFPVIVGQEAAFGLDFRTTTTTLLFGPQTDLEEREARLFRMRVPVGSRTERMLLNGIAP